MAIVSNRHAEVRTFAKRSGKSEAHRNHHGMVGICNRRRRVGERLRHFGLVLVGPGHHEERLSTGRADVLRMDGGILFEELPEFRMHRALTVVLKNHRIKDLSVLVLVEDQTVAAVVERGIAAEAIRTQIALDVMPVKPCAADCSHRC